MNREERRRFPALPPLQSRWPRWARFAETAVLAVGGTHIVSGILGLLRSGLILLPGGTSVQVGYEAVGWILVALGALALVAGIGAAVLIHLCNPVLFRGHPLWES